MTHLGKISSNPFKLDLRSLSLSRIAIGFSLLLNFIISANNLTIFFTDQGLMPREALPIKYAGVRHFSLCVLSGDYWLQAILICTGMIASICLMLGFYTRISIFICWIIFLSFFNRNPLIVDGGDDALKIFLLLLCFLPISKYFSLDQKEETKENSFFSTACIALIIQIGSIYFYSALLKTSPQWRVDGTALHYALALGVFTSSIGEKLLKFPALLKELTLVTWWVELIVPLFLLVPFFNKFFRSVAVLTFIGFHAGLCVFMTIGMFPITMISIWLALIPSWAWETKQGQIICHFLESLFNKIPFKSKHSAEPTFERSSLTNLFCYFFVIYITLWNIRSTNFDKFSPYFSPRLNFIGSAIRIDQYWALFAPKPTQDGGWDMQVGKLKNGSLVDLKTGHAVDFNRPKSTSSHYKDFRWKKYTLNTWLKTNSEFRKYFANYLCRTWNSAHTGGEMVDEVRIIFMLEKTLPPGITGFRAYPNPTVTWKQKCE